MLIALLHRDPIKDRPKTIWMRAVKVRYLVTRQH
jgi:hypothetical protein